MLGTEIREKLEASMDVALAQLWAAQMRRNLGLDIELKIVDAPTWAHEDVCLGCGEGHRMCGGRLEHAGGPAKRSACGVGTAGIGDRCHLDATFCAQCPNVSEKRYQAKLPENPSNLSYQGKRAR
jgi:hypothetical protein